MTKPIRKCFINPQVLAWAKAQDKPLIVTLTNMGYSHPRCEDGTWVWDGEDLTNQETTNNE